MAAAVSSPSQLDEIAARAGALYSLPAVAVEVLKLTENPRVDARALKDCIQQDPALTVKLLRVVNSSLFGLSREVGDLNQALALLGVKPLKMLVLGFSLPDDLLATVARDQLTWYWRHTLTRAVAAREISEQVTGQPGDEPFLAGLLQDIGVLALMGQLGAPYAAFLREVSEEQACLHHVQVEALGFDHTELSARLLDDWNMPAALVQAIAEPRSARRLATLRADHAATARTLHMADLTAQVVADRRFAALPDLLEVSRLYCGMDRAQLDELIQSLEPKVAQLADVFSLSLPNDQPYNDLLAAAHQQLAELAESAAVVQAAASPTRAPAGSPAESLATTQPLRSALDDYVAQDDAEPAAATSAATQDGSAAASSGDTGVLAAATASPDALHGPDQLVMRITLAVGACRAERQALSLVAIAIDDWDALSEPQQTVAAAALRQAWRSLHREEPLLPTDDPAIHLALLSNYERQEAVHVAGDAVGALRKTLENLHANRRLPKCKAAAGLATVSTPAKNFPPLNLLESALRCLAASQSSGGAIKSLEIS